MKLGSGVAEGGQSGDPRHWGNFNSMDAVNPHQSGNENQKKES